MSRMTNLKYFLLIPIIIFSFATVANAQKATKAKKEARAQKASPYETIEAHMKKWGFNEWERGKLLASSWRIFYDTRRVSPRLAANLQHILVITSKKRPTSMVRVDYQYYEGLKKKWIDILYRDKTEEQLGWIAYNVAIGPSLVSARGKYWDGRNMDPKKVLEEGNLAIISGGTRAKIEATAAKVAEAQRLGRMEKMQNGGGATPRGPTGGTVTGGQGGGPGDCMGDDGVPQFAGGPLGGPLPSYLGGQEGSGGAGGHMPWLSPGDIPLVSPLADPCGNVTGWGVPTGHAGGKPLTGSATHKRHKIYVTAWPQPGGGTKIEIKVKDTWAKRSLPTKKRTSSQTYVDGTIVKVVVDDSSSPTGSTTVPVKVKRPPAPAPAPDPDPAPAPAPDPDPAPAGKPLPTEDPDCIEAVIADDNCGGGDSGDCGTLQSALQGSSGGIAPIMPDQNQAYLAMGDCGGGPSNIAADFYKISGGYVTNWGPDGPDQGGGGGGDPCQMDPNPWMPSTPKDPAACCDIKPEMCGPGGPMAYVEHIENLLQQQ